jgi:hypothetical protein
LRVQQGVVSGRQIFMLVSRKSGWLTRLSAIQQVANWLGVPTIG